MAIAAHLEETVGSSELPREPRRSLRLEAQGALASGHATNVLVHNVSATGLLLESALPLAIDERIGVDLPQAGSTWAKIVWASGNLFGCQFDAPISAAALSAAQLRGVRGENVDIAPPRRTGADSSFGMLLQRLRRERGLTQSQLAVALGVSKPTVWAWEHGKARPVDARMAGLAEALGVTKAELVPLPAATAPSDAIASSREHIAAALGIGTDKVKIWVEL